MSSIDEVLSRFITELRLVGLPVSLVEHLDAQRAVRTIPWEDRQRFKETLASTVVKSAAHYPAYSVAFDVFFSGEGLALADGIERAPEGTAGGGGHVLQALDNGQLAELLYDAVTQGNVTTTKAVAGEAVDRYGGVQPGLAVAGVLYLYRTVEGLELDSLRDRRLGPHPPQVEDAEWGRRRDQLEANLHELRAELEAEIRRRLIADRGAEAVAAMLRRPLPEDTEFLRASEGEVALLGSLMQPLAAKISRRLAFQHRRRQHEVLDVRRTLRRSQSYGGVPVEPVLRRRKPPRSQIVLLADVSGSVAPFAAFTLGFLMAAMSNVVRLRCLVFVNSVDEVTDVLRTSSGVAEAVAEINARRGTTRLDEHTDYGRAFSDFFDSWAEQVTARTTIIVLGDGRNNYHASRAHVLAAIKQRADRVYWLNPEPEPAWGTGDSIIAEYAPFCDGVYECRTVRQLARFVDQLA